MIIPDEKEICKVLLEPDQTLLENIQDNQVSEKYYLYGLTVLS